MLLKLWMLYANIVSLVMKYSANSSAASDNFMTGLTMFAYFWIIRQLETEQVYSLIQVYVITLLKLWMLYVNTVGLVMKFSAKLHNQTAYGF